MSRIDEAFINAYTDQAAAPPPAAELRDGDAPHRVGPHFQVQRPGRNLRVFMHEEVEVIAEDPSESHDTRIDAPHSIAFETGGPAADAPDAAEPHAADPYCDDSCASEMSADESLELPPASRSLNGGSLESVERRPLSSFAEPVPPPAVFQPVFEVDAFRWPAITEQFCRARSELLQPVIDRLARCAHDGRAVVGLAGTCSGVGTSTVAMCLARLLAARGKNVALVDANFARGNLAPQLGLEFSAGWEDALSGYLPLAECVVHALDDRVSLLPLKGPLPESRELLAGIQTSVVAGVLRYHYDLVLFDLGAPANTPHWPAVKSVIDYCRLDVGIVVADAGEAELQASQSIAEITALFGAACLGVIGNSSISHPTSAGN